MVIDVHPTWCGPCEMMFPTFKMLQNTIDDFEKRVDILMLDYEKILQYKNDKFSNQFNNRPRTFLQAQVYLLFGRQNHRRSRRGQHSRTGRQSVQTYPHGLLSIKYNLINHCIPPSQCSTSYLTNTNAHAQSNSSSGIPSKNFNSSITISCSKTNCMN